MFRKLVLPALALIGLLLGLRVVRASNVTVPAAQPVVEPRRASFEACVAGAGIIESSSENISIAAPLGALVTQVLVKVGDKVEAGAPLFQLDDREQRAMVHVRQANVLVQESVLKDAQIQYGFIKGISQPGAVSEEELAKRRAAVEKAEAELAHAKAELNAAQTDLERLTVRAPISAEVLQVKVRAGEFAPAQALEQPLMIMGNTEVLHIRVDVDENDAWRVKSNARAAAFLRGNPKLSTDLKFVRFEPYVIPKRSLTGDSLERVDTRVLQVIYSYDKNALPAFVGQLVDVDIEEMR